MNKLIAAGALALTLSSAGHALAQPAPGGGPGPGGGPPWMSMTAEDRAALADARIAGLKATLRLRPDQEPLWTPLEAALREAATTRAARRQRWMEMRQQPGADPVQRLRLGADRMAEAAGEMRRIADAAAPLYASLDAAQKRRIDAIFNRVGRGGWGHGGGWGGGWGQRQ